MIWRAAARFSRSARVSGVARVASRSRAVVSPAAALLLGGGIVGGGVALCDGHRFDCERVHSPSYFGDVVIVTGGSTGIGQATAELFARAGATVYSLDVSPPGAGCSGAVHHVACDISDVAGVRAAVETIVGAHGKVDVLVSNAGVWCGGPLEDVSEAQFDRVVGINVKGTFFAIQAVLPSMRARKSGAIVIVGSDQSLVGKPSQNLYGMTKGAIAQLSKSCAAQYAPEGIRVNCVCPGTIDTPLMHGAVADFAVKNGQPKAELYEWLQTAQPLPRLGHPEEVAALIAAIAKIPFVCGSIISCDGGYTCQ